MKTVNRRQLLGYADGSLAVLVIGSKLPWLVADRAHTQVVQTLDFHLLLT